MNGNSDQAA